MKTRNPRAIPSKLAICAVAIVALLILPVANMPAAWSAPLASTVTIPNLVGFEGYLTDGSGQPISDGAHGLVFRVYSAATGPTTDALWVETQTITVTTGLYSALLGSVQTLTTNLFNGNRWIGVTVDGGTEVTPRTEVASVPFALNAEHANSAEWGSINGKPSNLVTGSAANGQVAWWNSSGSITGDSGLIYASNNLTVTGGLNTGSASGATSGQIRASGTITGSNLSGSNTGDVTLAGQNYLSLSGQTITVNPVNLSSSNATGTLAASSFPALTGDVNTSAGSLTTTIGTNKVTNTKLAQMASNTLKGNNTGGTTNAADLTVGQVNAMLGTVTGTGANTQLTYFNGASNVTGSANLTTNGSSLTIGGGVNVGGASGAGTGDIKASGTVSTTGGMDVGAVSGAAAGEIKLSGSIRQSTPLEARVYNSANISTNNNTTTWLTFDSERFDTDNIHSTSSNTGRLTASTDGYYLVTLQLVFANNTAGTRQIGIALSPSGNPGQRTITALVDVPAATGADVTALNCSVLQHLGIGDYVEARVVQTSGGALNVLSSSNYSPEFMMVRMP